MVFKYSGVKRKLVKKEKNKLTKVRLYNDV